MSSNLLSRQGKKWNREETILALDLYCRTPFSKVHQRNQDIIDLASLLGRTPSSVTLKLSNLAHYDPNLRARDIVGMAHSSKLDEEIFNEFYQDLGELSNQALIVKKNMGSDDYSQTIKQIDIESLPPGEYRKQQTKVRLGQYSFRLAILTSYHNRCCITGLSIPQLLIASHIKPWAECEEKTERTNPCNGLCLNSFHDKAFDKGFLTIDKHYKVKVSSQIRNAEMDDLTRKWFMEYEGKSISLPEKFLPSKSFIEYHNDVIFIP